MLAYFAARLTSVELNTTFYDYPTHETIDRWVGAVPDRFRFAIKAHHRLTHPRRFTPDGLEQFAGCLTRFGSRLGPVLFQLPATIEYQPDLLDQLLSTLCGRWRVAFQFRNVSWHVQAVEDAVERQGGAICHVDGEAPSGPLGRGAFIYIRLRQDAYSDADLDAWATRLTGFAASGRDVFAYFKHETRGPDYAEQLARRCRPRAARPPGV